MEKRVLIWDLPVRVLHWLLAITLLGAFAVAHLVDDDSPGFIGHMVLGLTAAVVVVLRVGWGIVGSKHARLGAHLFGPAALLRYLRSTFTGKAERHAGVNPGSAYASYAFWLLPLGLCATGFLMAGNHSLKEIHEVLALLVIVTTGVHLVGIAWHSFRHREALPVAMVTGQKVAPEGEALASSHVVPAVILLALALGAFFTIQSGVDWNTGKFTLFGNTVFQGEGEDEGKGKHEGAKSEEEHGKKGEHDDDDD